mmetsp:Transcript_25142/g.46864  ORF Transcript_25142/g.46864 Transcript_25142/m.46864 type:complete len:112 (+) Transcript_25142:1736-2071(+)
MRWRIQKWNSMECGGRKRSHENKMEYTYSGKQNGRPTRRTPNSNANIKQDGELYNNGTNKPKRKIRKSNTNTEDEYKPRVEYLPQVEDQPQIEQANKVPLSLFRRNNKERS